MTHCSNCSAVIDPHTILCPVCRSVVSIDSSVPPASGSIPPMGTPVPPMETAKNPYTAPKDMHSGQPHPGTSQGDATGGVIPYKNPKALIAYYLGILSGLPLIGLPLGIAAFILGILGLVARKKNPAIKGSLHAGVGIGCGGLFTIVWGLVVVSILAALVAG